MQRLPLKFKSNRKRRANFLRGGVLAIAAACAAAAFSAGPQTARAIVVPTPAPARGEVTTQSSSPNATVLPLSSSLFFVLDDTISSHTKAGTTVRAHLRDPIMLGGKTVARAGSPVTIVVTESSAAQAGNIDGFVEMYFEALALGTGQSLPLTTPSALVNPHTTAGQESTRGITDTVGDIFIPGHFLYHMLRKGSDVTLRPGTIIRARTAATLRVARGGAIAVNTPAPFSSSFDTPHPGFEPAPFATPPGFHVPTPKPSPSVKPATTP